MKQGLLIVGGGVLQRFALRRARELNIETYLVDGSASCASRDLADHFYQISTKDFEGIAELAKRLAREKRISGIYTQGADVEYSVAYAAKAAGLPGIEPQAAYNCHNKIHTRELLAKAGVSKVPFMVLGSFAEAKQVASQVGFPCYVKPVDNSASRGMTRLEDATGLEAAILEALSASYLTKKVLIEREVPGKEYSVDTILYEGNLYPAGISDRIFQEKERYAVQNGSYTPSRLPALLQDKMYKLMHSAAKALGISSGPFKGDLVIRENTDEIEIIEVTARTSGGYDSQLRKPLSFGIDLIKASMDIALGKPLNPLDLIPRWIKWSSTFSIFPQPGVVTQILGLEAVSSLPGVAHIDILVKPGDVVEAYTHSAKRTNSITCTADSYELLQGLESTIRKLLVIETVELN